MNLSRGAEGLLVAIEMERRGVQLYRRAQLCTPDKALIALLAVMESEEAQHLATFQAMLDALGEPEMTTEEVSLATARAADFFFPGGLMQVAMAGALASAEAMLDVAIQAERDAIDFYTRLQDHLPDDQRQPALNILREEEGHLRSLFVKKAEQK